MKTTKIYLMICITSVLIFSCKKSESETLTPDPIAQETPDDTEPAVETPEVVEPVVSSNEESNEITTDIVINGSTKIEGEPPVPNEAISLDLSQTRTTAIIGEGFDIDFSSDADIIGAYIQFKTSDAPVADSYFDVNILDNSDEDNNAGKSKRTSKFARKMNDENVIDVDLNPELTTGEFCYVICVYDQAGNISAPQEVCVSIKSWGGNDELVGTWNLTRSEDLFNGETEINTVGVEECDEPSAGTISYCYLLDNQTFIFKADGTFEYNFKEFEKEIPTESEYTTYYTDIVRGNWSFDATTDELYFVVYFEEFGKNETIEETNNYPIGNGYLVKVDRMVIEGNTLELIFEGDSDINSKYTEFYDRD